jgi:hypothetical protein
VESKDSLIDAKDEIHDLKDKLCVAEAKLHASDDFVAACMNAAPNCQSTLTG